MINLDFFFTIVGRPTDFDETLSGHPRVRCYANGVRSDRARVRTKKTSFAKRGKEKITAAR